MRPWQFDYKHAELFLVHEITFIKTPCKGGDADRDH